MDTGTLGDITTRWATAHTHAALHEGDPHQTIDEACLVISTLLDEARRLRTVLDTVYKDLGARRQPRGE